MTEEKKSTSVASTQSPEERFKELIAIRGKEQEVRAKIDAAHAAAQRQLQEGEEQIQSKRAQTEKEIQAEMERARTQAIKEAEAEAQKLLETVEAQAKALEAKARERQPALLEKLKQELLAIKQ